MSQTNATDYQMVDFEHPGGTPTPDEVRRRFGLAADELDEHFGVRRLEPDTRPNTYTVQVAPAAAPRVTGGPDADASSDPPRVYSNPRIEPFGPVR